MAHGYNPAKVQNSNIRHDGILSIGNFMLMRNNHFARFQLPGYLLKTKINRKFRVATEIGSTFFGCWSVTGQLKK
jgi:hypothetical protein